MTETVKLTLRDQVAWITLNRPDRLNAISPQLVDDFTAVLDEITRTDQARVVVLTGEGRAFCAGGDLKDPVFEVGSFEEREPIVARGYHLTRRLRELPVPLIAAVNGACAGAGMLFVAVSDLRVAAETAKFSLDFVKVGLLPDMGTSHLLPNVVGTSEAMEMALLAEPFTADEAQQKGLVTRVTPLDELVGEVELMAQRIVSMPPLAVRAIKRSIHELPGLPFESALRLEADRINHLIGTPDVHEAINAFSEGREPVFTGAPSDS